MESKYVWTSFYKEFAKKLLSYKSNRTELVQKVKEIYIKTGINMPTLENGDLIDIDPFTVFGLFNKHLTEANRIKIVTAVKELFSVQEEIPSSFDGLPVLNNQNATFYYFIPDRGASDIDDLWDLFESALKYVEVQNEENRRSVCSSFDCAINKKGNGNSKITMALFWIAPEFYLNLDSRNVWYIYKSGKIPQSLAATLPKIDQKAKVSSSTYFEVLDRVREFLKGDESDVKDFVNLSAEAWKYSQEVNEKIAESKKKEDTLSDDTNDAVHYWMYTIYDEESWKDCLAKQEIVMGLDEIGDLSVYSEKEDIRKALASQTEANGSQKNLALMAWEFSHVMKSGDIVFAKRSTDTIVAKGVVTDGYYFDDGRECRKNVLPVEWQITEDKPHPGRAVAKRLTDITRYTDYVEQLLSLYSDEDTEPDYGNVTAYDPYTKADFLKDVYMPEKAYDSLVKVIKAKKNIIIQGAPGVGKTYCAKRLAYSIMGEKDTSRVQMVQFHQSYSYEDFIEGYRPDGNGFILNKGAFYRFCDDARNDEDRDYFFIIDEINRGNLSKIFGELFMLIENDKRGIELQLLYSRERFSVPKNLYIIGMMNTADRSLAMLDYALRRRFSFIDLKPGFDTDGFKEYKDTLNCNKFNRLIDCVSALNDKIAADESLGEGFCIGHSYFCNLKPESVDNDLLSSIVEYEIIPLLKEYWFDEVTNVRDWSDRLRRSIQ